MAWFANPCCSNASCPLCRENRAKSSFQGSVVLADIEALGVAGVPERCRATPSGQRDRPEPTDLCPKKAGRWGAALPGERPADTLIGSSLRRIPTAAALTSSSPGDVCGRWRSFMFDPRRERWRQARFVCSCRFPCHGVDRESDSGRSRVLPTQQRHFRWWVLGYPCRPDAIAVAGQSSIRKHQLPENKHAGRDLMHPRYA